MGFGVEERGGGGEVGVGRGAGARAKEQGPQRRPEEETNSTKWTDEGP